MAAKKHSTRISPPRGNLIASGKDFEMYRYMRGDFQVVRIFGRTTPAVLQALRSKVFNENKGVAIDVASIAEPGHPFARELLLNARRLRNHGRYLVLINARGRIRDLIRTGASEELIPFLLTESMLDGNSTNFAGRLTASRAILKKIHADIKTNPSWKMSDRDDLWLCPYCATTQDHISVNSKGVPLDNTVELMAIHLLEECKPFREKQSLLAMSDLSKKLKKLNQDKLMASKESASMLVSRMVELQEQVNDAADLRHSMEVASQRQRFLLPNSPPEMKGVQFGLGYRPAQRVSGDFYDFLELDDGKIGLVMGDVSGHGIEAALLMGVAKKLLNIRLKDTGDPVEALKLANRDLFPDLDRKTFVTVFIGHYHPETRFFTFARAGHNPTMIYNPARNPEFVRLEPAGMGLGMDSGTRFNPSVKVDSALLQPGDLMFMYTDGLAEAMNPDQEEFGMDRVCDILSTHYAATPQSLIDTVYSEIDAFSQGAPQEDDITMVAMKLNE